MKRLIVSGAVLLGCFSSIVAGCGSRSSDTDYLPGATAGESGLGAGAGLANSGATAVGGASAGFTSAAGASGFANAAGASGNGAGGAHFAGAGGAIGFAGFGGSAGRAAGGTSSAGATTGGSATGGAAMGGTTSTGGSSGASGSSGAGGGNSASCPVALPNTNSMCPSAALQCNYTGRSCACRARGNNLTWRCTGSGNACPGTEPTAATACMGALQCPYPDGQQCNCGASGQWDCFTAGCPANKPTPSGSCGSVFGQCTYGTGAGSACVCVAGGWFCN